MKPTTKHQDKILKVLANGGRLLNYGLSYDLTDEDGNTESVRYQTVAILSGSGLIAFKMDYPAIGVNGYLLTSIGKDYIKQKNHERNHKKESYENTAGN